MSIRPVPLVQGQAVLHPGDIALGRRGDLLQTLLGSCIAVLLADAQGEIGVMCHLVHAGSPPSSVPDPEDARWGAMALPALFALLRAHGVDPADCAATVVGGGHLFANMPADDQVGARNADWSLQALAAQGLPVVHQDLGGCVYRKLSWRIGEAPRVQRMPVRLSLEQA